MLDPSFVSQIAQTLYGFEPQSIESLEINQFDWRGIYRIQDAQGGAWVMRLLHDSEAIDSLTHTARLVDWLSQQSFPAPLVRKTITQQLVGMVDGWAVTLLSYVEGSVLGLDAINDFGAFAQTVGRLHNVKVVDSHMFASSRCTLEQIATAARQLASYGAKLPKPFQPLATDLHATMLALQQQLGPHLSITHGDCWYMNAIKVQDGSVALIDWDQSGIGLPSLDLGNLLLTSHFDLTRPLLLEADEAKIKAIIQGYQEQSRIIERDQESIANAMRFLLAFQLGEYVADDALFLHLDFPFVLQKLQARYDVTGVIADIAVRYVEQSH